jgi:hypothetical protein
MKIEQLHDVTNERIEGSRAVLVRVTFSDGAVNHYRASYIPGAFDTHQPETLVFPCDDEGTITEWTEVAGGMHMSIDDAIEHLRAVLNEEKSYSIMDSPMMVHAGGNPLLAMVNTIGGMADRLKSDPFDEDEDDE